MHESWQAIRTAEGVVGMFKKILIAVDLSDMAQAVLHFGIRFAKESAAQPVIATVVSDPLRQPYVIEAVGADWVRLRKEWLAAAEAQLRRMVQREGAEAGAFPMIVVMGQEADTIVELARAHAADAIVIGTHGYGPVKHFVLGSVAERVLRMADCPVLTAPQRFLDQDRVSN